MKPSLLTTFLLAASSSASTLPSRQATCYTGIYLVVAPGTFENLEFWSEFGFQTPVINAILSKIPDSHAALVVYPENTDVSVGVPQGVTSAQGLLTDYYTACPGHKMALMGYSQGAIVTGSTLAGGPAWVPIFGSTGTGPSALSREVGDQIVAIVQFGDLNRVQGIGYNADVSDTPCAVSALYPRNGTALTNWAYYSDRIDEFCANSDGACCAGGLNIFAHIGYFTDANVEAASNFVLGKFNGTL